MSTDSGTLYGLDRARHSLTPYLRALWNQGFALHASEKPLTQQRGFISERGIHLPRHYHSHRGEALRDLYRAAAAHAAAHLRYSEHRFEHGALKPVQMALIGVLEDARIEQLAIQEMPGLRALWLQFFDPQGRDSTSADALLLRLSHVLLDPHRDDRNPWVMEAARLFHLSQQHGSDPQVLRALGSRLGNDLGQMRAQFNAKSYVIEPVYRDDNLFLWISETPPEETRIDDSGFVHEENAAETEQRFDLRADEDTRCRPRDVAAGNAENEANDDSSLPRYPEWDARIGRYRERWCRIIEREPPAGDPSVLLVTRDTQSRLSARLAQLLQARKQGRVQRLRRQPEGEEFELDALVHAISELRCGRMPEWRVHRRSVRQKPDLSVLLLLDLSASTDAAISAAARTATSESTVLSLIREASLLLGAAVGQSGDRYAIHGFRSNGRHEVEYLRFKGFDEAMDDRVLATLSGTTGALSTRMGAAIRHASHQMRHCRSTQRLILMLTDGEPHDIDVFDPAHLVHDAARAVERSTAEGTPVFCVSVDPTADTYLQKIFGAHHYRIIDHVEQLPKRVPELYLRLTA